MKMTITLKPFSAEDWAEIMADDRLRSLIGIPIGYFISPGGMFHVWPSPVYIPNFSGYSEVTEEKERDDRTLWERATRKTPFSAGNT